MKKLLSINNSLNFKVEDLLSSYLKDVGINEEQFVQACGAPSLQSRPQMQVQIYSLLFIVQ